MKTAPTKQRSTQAEKIRSSWSWPRTPGTLRTPGMPRKVRMVRTGQTTRPIGTTEQRKKQAMTATTKSTPTTAVLWPWPLRRRAPG